MQRAAILALALAGCSVSTELYPGSDSGGAGGSADLRVVDGPVSGGDGSMPPDMAGPAPRDYPFCPTRIDVFGAENVLLEGCGGPSLAMFPLEGGYFAPGTPSYDATLAGRLLSRLQADPDLAPRFGTTFTVRSCGASTGQLTSLTPSLKDDFCGMDTPQGMGSLTTLCAMSPAPVAIVAADMTSDRCHGGGPDTFRMSDATTFSAHVSTRLDALRARLGAGLLLVGPRPEWQPAQTTDLMGMQRFDAKSCTLDRGDWNHAAVESWALADPTRPDVILASEPDQRFRSHHRCCMSLGLPCEAGWYTASHTGPPGILNCDGAQQVVDFWYAHLKQALLANHFKCP